MDKESDFLPNKRGRSVDGGVDRISQLSDDIIIRILSLLTLKNAKATSVLSFRWLDLWKHTRILDFVWYDLLPDTLFGGVHEKRFIDIVNLVIRSHKAISLEKFRIQLFVRKSDKCSITKWLEFVFSKQVESLDLNLMWFKKDVEFVLDELMKESRINLQPQTDLIFFQSLKSLSLGNLRVSGEDIELFLCNCPLLEKLKIQSGTLTSDVAVYGEKLLLKHLVFISCIVEKCIKVSAPNLTCMRFSIYKGKLFLENAPKLVEADFSIESPDFIEQHFASSASCYFSQLQILHVNLYESKTLCQLQVVLANGSTRMPNLKKLDIKCFGMYTSSLLPITALIWAHPLLEEFKLECSYEIEEQPAYMQVVTNVGRSPHQHLKVFDLQLYRWQSVRADTVELVDYISNNCVALQKIIIGCQYTLAEPAIVDFITQRLQGKVPSHIQLELFNHRF